MDIDSAFLEELIKTFDAELEERLQVITDGLLLLEKNQFDKESKEKTIESIFRSAHNIKGTARNIGIKDVADIAHHMESLFLGIQKKIADANPIIIDLCLEAVDGMRSAMQSFIKKSPLDFDLTKLLTRLEQDQLIEPKKINQETAVIENNTTLKKNMTDYETIRVSLGNVEKISALMEEIQVNKIAIDDYYLELAKLYKKTQRFNQSLKHRLISEKMDYLTEFSNDIRVLYENMRRYVKELNIVSHSLQEEVRMLRLIPVSTLFRTFPRTVRDLAQSLNKEVSLEIKDNDVKIDKMALEAVKDPIIHILRNAIDHGIESAEDRDACGKPRVGHITIAIKEVGNQMLIQISDDGRGIDFHNIAKTAEKKSLYTQEALANMSESEVLELIFHPGFSTKENITAVSGRGVGLDVVKENINTLKGHVKLTTEIGKGTVFNLYLPLTLTSELGLTIKCHDQLFIIPITGIERVLLLNSSEVLEIQGNQAILLDEHPILLYELADVLQLEKNPIQNKDLLSIFVIKKENTAVALLVDEIVGEQEIVIKSLQPPLNYVPCVAGGSLSGSGQVVIVLNASDLIDKTLYTEKSKSIDLQDKTIPLPERKNILVVDDSITTRNLQKNILESKGYEVTVAVNGKEAWDILQKQTFSLLITDISMPIMDGLTLTNNVKQSSELHHLPVIIVTSQGSDADKKRGIDVGTNAYIVKSEFESSALLEIVEQLI